MREGENVGSDHVREKRSVGVEILRSGVNLTLGEEINLDVAVVGYNR